MNSACLGVLPHGKSCGRGVFTGALWYKKEEKESALRLYLKPVVNIHVFRVLCGNLFVAQNLVAGNLHFNS